MLLRLALIRLYGFWLTGKIALAKFRNQRYGLCDAVGIVVVRRPEGLGLPVFGVIDAAAAAFLRCFTIENPDHSFNWTRRANKLFMRFRRLLPSTHIGRGQEEDPEESNPIGRLHENPRNGFIKAIAPDRGVVQGDEAAGHRRG